MTDARPGFLARLALAFATFFRLLFDAAFAARVARLEAVAEPSAPLPSQPPVAPAPSSPVVVAPPPPAVDEAAVAVGGALALLALFQREGRLVDFVEQDVTSFSDADVGAAARLVHEGCRKALRAHATVAPLRSEAEESRVTIDEGYEPAEVKLTGKVGPKPPYKGTLRHAGWRVRDLRLPRALDGHDATIVAPAEVEL